MSAVTPRSFFTLQSNYETDLNQSEVHHVWCEVSWSVGLQQEKQQGDSLQAFFDLKNDILHTHCGYKKVAK